MTTIPADAYVIIIGAMKCGTSSLYTYLAEHSEICSCITKEPEFFSRCQAHRYDRVAKYEDLWNFDLTRHRFALEASTGYTKYPEEIDIPKRIFEYGLRPKFIYIVRNPFDRIRSHYEQLGRLFPEFDYSTPLSSDTFVNTSNYTLQLDQYRPYFPKESIFILDFDDLRTSPHQCLAKTCSFLGISEQHLPNSYPVHHQTESRHQALLSRRPLLRKTVKALPRSARRAGSLILERIFKRPEWDSREREIVRERLAKDMHRFQAEYGFDVSRWGWA